MNLIEWIDLELSQEVINMPLAAMYHSGYLEIGEYAKTVENLKLTLEEETEAIFTFLWLILVAEGYEK